MQEYFKNLYCYNYWANSKVADILTEHNLGDEALKLYSHILNAELTWAGRITLLPIGKGIWDVRERSELKGLTEESRLAYEKILNEHTDFTTSISYINSMGAAYTEPLTVILTQCTNHSNYHRAQIARIIREKGYTPPSTDYILYYRELSK